jgi:hypothetical protein
MRHREQARQPRRIIETMATAIVDPGGDPAEAKSIEAEIVWHSKSLRLPMHAHLSRPLTAMSLEQPLRQQRVAERAAGAHGSGDQGCFGDFLACRPGLRCLGGMHVEAIGGLRGQRDRERDRVIFFAGQPPTAR